MRKTFCLLVLGSLLESYEFAVYAFFAKPLGMELIPVRDELTNIIITFAIMSCGAVARPIGGLVFAHFGDNNGRKDVFSSTILLMALPTFAISLIPSYNKIGIFAVILLLLMRILQNFALGGEVPAAIAYAYESSPEKRRALYTNIVVAGTNLGLLLASIVCAELIQIKFPISSWRIAFFIGGVFGIFSYFLRKSLSESPEFLKLKNIEKKEAPIVHVFKNYRQELITMTSFSAMIASMVIVYTSFMPTYLNVFYKIPLSKTLVFTGYATLIFTISAFLAGVFNQFFGKKFFVYGAIIFSFVSTISFMNYQFLTFKQIEVIQLCTLVYIGLLAGRLPVTIAGFFPTQIRYTGGAFSYNIAFGIIGGLTNVILFGLIELTNILWIPALFMLFFIIIALWYLVKVPAKRFINYQ